ncbi:MAG: DUF309 domain-containing protein [Desulfobulbaceae bacterium]|nr:DUF309 domain-containing protein [Desulfobulbaceae bacterium]
MTSKHFDPFNDRLARDIRNTLSEALAAQLAELDLTPVHRAATTWTATDLAPTYRAYIDDRLARYERAFAIIRARGVNTPFQAALILWDEALFFEFHEILEELWLQAEGAEKQALQALIRASGVYVHLAEGHMDAARSMADKAAAGLAAHGHALPAPMDCSPLILALTRLDASPPRLASTG